MLPLLRTILAFLAVQLAVSSEIMIESFADPHLQWETMNDPVMGGKSTGAFCIHHGKGVFTGEVVDVPFFHAPGFIQVRAKSFDFPDVSSCTSLQVKLRVNDDSYKGYKISFGNAHAPGGTFFARGYKANMMNLPTNDFGSITIPFSDFTDFWDDATGEPIHTCLENPLYCPDKATLKNFGSLAIWAEGVAGRVTMEIQSISATGCSEESEEEE
jgi:hypothetical protein